MYIVRPVQPAYLVCCSSGNRISTKGVCRVGGWVGVCASVCLCLPVCACVCVRTYVHTYVCVFVYVCVCVWW